MPFDGLRVHISIILQLANALNLVVVEHLKREVTFKNLRVDHAGHLIFLVSQTTYFFYSLLLSQYIASLILLFQLFGCREFVFDVFDCFSVQVISEVVIFLTFEEVVDLVKPVLLFVALIAK